MNEIKVIKKFNKYTKENSYLIYCNNYYLEIGNKSNLIFLMYVLENFKKAKIDNNNPFFKISFNEKSFYLTYKPSNKKLCLNREDIGTLLANLYIKKIGY